MTTQGISMEKKRVMLVEFCVGVLFIATGLFVWWWSQQLPWILIFPPPMAKQIIETIPFVSVGLGVLFLLDAIRRKLRK